MWTTWCIRYFNALGPRRTGWLAGGGGGGGAGAGEGAEEFVGVGFDGVLREAHAKARALAATRKRRRIDYSLFLVRPKMATTSVPSLETFSSFQPRLRISVRHAMSFSHSSAVVRKTRKSATFSQWGGYGADGGLAVTGVEVAGP